MPTWRSTSARPTQVVSGYGVAHAAGTRRIEWSCREDLTAVWIASPSYLHYEQCSALLRAGKRALADIGTHHVDLLRMLLGEVAGATGFAARKLGLGTDDADTAPLRFESGALATVTASVSVWKPHTRANPWVLQVEAITQAARGDDVACASGEDGARNLDVLEQIVP